MEHNKILSWIQGHKTTCSWVSLVWLILITTVDLQAFLRNIARFPIQPVDGAVREGQETKHLLCVFRYQAACADKCWEIQGETCNETVPVVVMSVSFIVRYRMELFVLFSVGKFHFSLFIIFQPLFTPRSKWTTLHDSTGVWHCTLQ